MLSEDDLKFNFMKASIFNFDDCLIVSNLCDTEEQDMNKMCI